MLSDQVYDWPKYRN